MQAFEPALDPPRGPDRHKAHSTFALNLPSADGLFIRQIYESYSPADHATWRLLGDRMRESWNRYACDRFLEGAEALHLPSAEVPHLDEVNACLSPRSGFRASAVSGRVAPFAFLDCLRNRVLPTAVTLRSTESLDYPAESDIFHDVAGHVPMLADRVFAEALVCFGDCAHSAAEIAGLIHDPEELRCRLTSILKAIGRFYSFTVEFGLVLYGDRVRAYGSGLLSSAGEIEHAIESAQVQRCEMNMDWVIHQPFERNRYQPLLFFVENFDQLLELTRTLERWMWEGRLDHVASGEPELSSADLAGFLQACNSR